MDVPSEQGFKTYLTTQHPKLLILDWNLDAKLILSSTHLEMLFGTQTISIRHRIDELFLLRFQILLQPTSARWRKLQDEESVSIGQDLQP